VQRRDQRVLSQDEIGRLLEAAPPQFRIFLTAAVSTGLRLGELQALTWRDLDFDAGFVRVRWQLDRDGTLREPKTPQARRDVVLMPALAKALIEHRLASPYSAPADYVFASKAGTPLNFHNVERRGLDAAAEAAGLNGDGRPKLRLHDLRHTFASLLIAAGADVVFVSRQLGHAGPEITLKVYSHLYDAHKNAHRMRALLESSLGATLAGGGEAAEDKAAELIVLAPAEAE
jgi:integrase